MSNHTSSPRPLAFLPACAALALSLLAVGACSDDDDSSLMAPDAPAAPIEDGFVLSTSSGAFPNVTTYVQWSEDLELSSIDNDDAAELPGSAATVAYANAAYATPFGAPAALVKYVVSAEAEVAEEERIVVPGANVFSTMYFASDTVAYATVAGGISKLIVFDPSTMRITDEVDLRTVTQRIPEATRTYYLDIVERAGKLFMGVHYENNFQPVNDSAYVAVVDLASRSVEAVLVDGRTGMVFGGQAPNAGLVVDDDGDIYVQGLGTTNAGGTSPSGVLRINAGETAFDPDYFFDLEEATGNISWGIYRTSDDQAFTATVQDETDLFEFATGEPQYKYVGIDLKAQTSSGPVPGLPTTYGNRRMIVRELDGDRLLFTIATNTENAAYVYEAGADAAGVLFVSEGGNLTGVEALE